MQLTQRGQGKIKITRRRERETIEEIRSHAVSKYGTVNCEHLEKPRDILPRPPKHPE
jgi:hypothetical protein